MSTHERTIRRLACSLALAGALVLALTANAIAVTPNQFLLSSHFGLEVNKTKVQAGAPQQERDICAVASGDECQPGASDESGVAGGYYYPGSVTVNKHGDVYIADSANHRVQELGPEGAFISMFGWNVNQTKVEEFGATQQERDVCSAASTNVCQPGEAGGGTGLPEQVGYVSSVAVDQSTGDVYVLTQEYNRVEEFTETGVFVWMAGREVNETQDNLGGTEAQKNLCTLASTNVCKAGVEAEAESKAPNAFRVEGGYGNLLAVGGPEDLLYIGDEGRVQQLRASGESAGEIPLTELSSSARATAVAVESTGDVFVGDPASPGVHELNPSGQLQGQAIGPAGPNTTVEGIALDPDGRLGILSFAVIEVQPGESEYVTSGLLYSTGGVKVSAFAPPSGPLTGSPHSLAFAPATAPLPDELYVVETTSQEVEAYEAVVSPEERTCPPLGQPTANAATLCGEINPNGVASKGLFQYGPTPALGSHTATVFEGAGTTFTAMRAEVGELEPNETYYYRAAGEFTASGRTLQTRGEEQTFHTATLPPVIVEQPSAAHVGEQSADLSAAVNPEHLRTVYYFEYAPCPSLSGCASIATTPAQESAQYSPIGDVQELTGLEPATTYAYRLVASSEAEEGGKPIGGRAVSQEGSFTTGALPLLSASTGPASAITPTTVTLAGSVDPGGEPAGYAFELGVYNPAGTQYGTILSAPAGESTTPTPESTTLTGLQPGTTYAYRITIHSGYGEATGATATFTTQGLPSVLVSPTSLPMLATPSIAFPTEQKGNTTTTKALTRKQKLAKALKQCKKDRKKSKRQACEKSAHKKYPTAKKKSKSSKKKG